MSTTFPGFAGSTRCFFCNRSTLPNPRRNLRRKVQSYLLTEECLKHRPYIVHYSRYLYSETRNITPEERICKPRVQHADRFVKLGLKREHDAEASHIDTEAIHSSQAVFDENWLEIKLSPEKHTTAAVLKKDELSSDPFADSQLTKEALLPEDEPVKTNLDPNTNNSPKDQPAQNLECGKNDQSKDIAADNPIKDKKETRPVEKTTQIRSPPASTFPIPGFSRLSYSSNLCIIKDCKAHKLHRIPLILRRGVLCKQNLYISNGSRICLKHVTNLEIMQNLASHGRCSHATFTSVQMAEMLTLLQKDCIQYFDFDALVTGWKWTSDDSEPNVKKKRQKTAEAANKITASNGTEAVINNDNTESVSASDNIGTEVEKQNKECEQPPT